MPWSRTSPDGSHYDAQQVCMNGHQITVFYHESQETRRDYCEKCGAKTIHKCLKCDAEIKGRHIVPGVIGFYETPVPEFCDACGEPYPWKKVGGTKAAVSESDLAPILAKLGLTSQWTLAASSLSLFELLVNKKLEQLKIDASGEFHVKVTKLGEAMKKSKDFPSLMISAFREVRNKVLKAGKEPTPDEMADIVKYLRILGDSLS